MSMEHYGKMSDERLKELFKSSIEVSGFYAQTEEEHWQGILRSFANRVLMEFADCSVERTKQAMNIPFPWQIKKEDDALDPAK